MLWVAEDFAGGEVDDGDGGVVGDGEDACAAVGGADAEVVHAAGAAEADLPVVVDVVVAEPVVAGAVSGGSGFGRGGVGVRGVVRRQGAVGSVRSCRCAERVELGLEFGRGSRRRAVGSQRFRVWWNRSILPWVCGWFGGPFFWRMPRAARRYSNSLRPPVKRAV